MPFAAFFKYINVEINSTYYLFTITAHVQIIHFIAMSIHFIYRFQLRNLSKWKSKAHLNHILWF